MRLLPLLALLILGCPAQPEPEPEEPTPEPVAHLPEVVPVEWLEGLSGGIVHHQEYFGGYVSGTTCDESFEAHGANITGFEPNECAQCELVFSLFLNQTADCLGDDVLQEEGELGLDLRQASGEAVFWWWNNGFFGWGEGWDELGTGTLVQNEEDLTLDVHFEFEDPRNSANGPWTADGDCGWFGEDQCKWHGTYVIDVRLAMDPNLVEWEYE